jgi:hypothetical protein
MSNYDDDRESYQSPVDKLGLDEADRYDFQNRRYGRSFVVVGIVRSGKIIATNPLRDPIAVIETLDQLRALLRDEQLKSYSWQTRATKRFDEQKQALSEEDAALSTIKIDL